MESDSEWEETSARTRSCAKTAGRRHHPVLVLSELEESERVGRVCRAQKYKLVRRCNEADLNVEKVVRIDASPIKDTEKVSGANHEDRATGRGKERKRGTEKKARRSSDHKKLSHQEKELPLRKKYTCNLCGAEYLNRSKLVSHMRLHTGETPYLCKVCGKGFRRSDWAAKHMNMHKDKSQAGHASKQHTCDYCGKRYTNKRALEAHLHVHTKTSRARPSQCPICKMRFYDDGTLKRHLTCHSDDRPFTCSECGHSFKRTGTLNKHKRIHTGEKPYPCSACGKAFRYRYSVLLHAKVCRRLRVKSQFI